MAMVSELIEWVRHDKVMGQLSVKTQVAIGSVLVLETLVTIAVFVWAMATHA